MQIEIILSCVIAAILFSIAMGIEDWITRRRCERFWEAAKRRSEQKYRDRIRR